jgi:cytochrome P450
MNEHPVTLTGLDALRGYFRFLVDPVVAMREAYAAYGPFVIVAAPLRIGPLRRSVVLAAGARFNREVLGDPAMWRTIHIMAIDRKDTAARRVGFGIISMTGPRHAHYRRLMVAPLRRPNVDALGERMALLAEQAIERWPVGQPFDLWSHVRGLMQSLAIALLFGDDREHGLAVAHLVNQRLQFKWTPGALACPFNVPFTPYGMMRRQSEELEGRIVAWAGRKRGHLDGRDLMSIIVNNPDESGNAPSEALLAGHVPTMFAAAYDTCQTALAWTLILLAQHPAVARDLADELQARLAGAPATLDRVGGLPLLDGVIKESMRLLPPAALQVRIAQAPTQLGGVAVPTGTRAVLSAIVTNRLPHLYPDPDRFKPGRWQTIDPSPYEYSVFSGGPRSCPGFWFGLGVLKVVLATIMSRHRVALQPNTRIDYQIRVTMAPSGAVPAHLLPLDHAFAGVPLRGAINKMIRFPA